MDFQYVPATVLYCTVFTGQHISVSRSSFWQNDAVGAIWFSFPG